LSSLYLEHFRLSEPPFGITPNGRFFFEGRTHGAILGALQHAVMDEEGIIVVVGEVGSGKTMLCRMLAERLPRERVDLVYLANPSFGPREILQSLLMDWGLSAGPDQSPVQVIQAALIQRHAQGRRVVVLIDEAQAMPPESLEEIKLLSNLETAQHKLLQIVLFGQPELDGLLGQTRLRQVRDRVVHRFDLSPLDTDDAMAYVDHRLRRAGWTGGALFESKALQQLVVSAGGRVRAIHLLADKALLAAFAQGERQVNRSHVERAVAEHRAGSGMGSARSVWGWSGRSIVASAVAVGAILALGIGVGYALGPRAPMAAPAPSTPPASQPAAVSEAWEHAAPRSSVPHAGTVPTEPVAAVSEALPKPLSAPASSEASAPTVATLPPPVALPAQAQTQRYASLPAELRAQVLASRAVLDDASQQGWTLQLGIADSSLAAARLAGQAAGLSPVWVHDRAYARRGPVWAVYAGRYASREDAARALQSLTATPGGGRPQIRTLGGIRSEPYPDRAPP
jgi:type II secretory pathway predicted ATPase ExeA/septal ring-binding cell division protein DamX